MTDYEVKVRNKIKHFGKLLGFEVEEEWSPSTFKKMSREEVYIPRIDVAWSRRCSPQFIDFLAVFKDQKVLDPYRDIEKEIIVGFELELTDRATKYILGDISNLSRLCDYDFIVMKNIENLVKRSIKASQAFSLLHGTSNVFVVDPEKLEDIIEKVASELQMPKN
jgi:hypothetical protein